MISIRNYFKIVLDYVSKMAKKPLDLLYELHKLLKQLTREKATIIEQLRYFLP